MKAKINVSGTDGSKHYEPGDTCEIDSDWLRKMLVNGLAEPEDDAAKAVCAKADIVARYRSGALTENAQAMGIPKSKIPALAVGN